MIHDPASREKPDVGDINQRFYDGLWADARLVGTDRFNTWDLVSGLAD